MHPIYCDMSSECNIWPSECDIWNCRLTCDISKKGFHHYWECYNAKDFYGCESDHVVAVTTGSPFTFEMATRTKTRLILILILKKEEENWKGKYADYQKDFQAAANKGLLKLIYLRENK